MRSGAVFPRGEIKLARVGGSSGSLLPEDLLDTPVGYRSLEKKGPWWEMEILVGGRETCVVALVCSGASTAQAASCGRCVFCREVRADVGYSG